MSVSTTSTAKRSYTPFFWLLFGAGGIMSAIFFPVLILFVGFILPFASHETSMHFVSILTSKIGVLFFVAITITSIWCACFRLTHLLDELKVPGKNKTNIIFTCAGILSVIILIAGAIQFFH